jgi:hypothetical protein
MFYLLKSTNDREKVGDVIICLEKIESFYAQYDQEEKNYLLRVVMNSKDSWVAAFNTEEELKNEMVNLGLSRETANEYLVKTKPTKKDMAEEAMKNMFGHRMS